MPGGRPKGTGGTPAQRRMAARIEADFPEYQPVAVMAEAAIALAEKHRPFSEAPLEAVEAVIAANDKVAAYLTPKLKAIEHSGEGGGPIVLQQAKGDEAL